MNTIWRFLKVFTLGTWVGGMIFFDFFVAGTLFRTLKDTDQAGTIVGLLLWRLHILGIIAAVIFLISAMLVRRSWKGLVKPSAILVELMLLATLVLQVWVMPAMDNLRLQMGSYMNTATASPLRTQFDRLHTISTRVEGLILVMGIVSLILTVLGFWRPQSVSTVAASPLPTKRAV